MATKFSRLNRESDPPGSQPASPTPQYWDRETEGPEDVEGIKGAPFAVLLGPNGQPISSANRLPVEATLSGRITEPLHLNIKTIAAKSGEDIFVDVPISDNGRAVAWDIVFQTAASLSAFTPRLSLARNTNDYGSAANAVAINIDVLDWMEIYHRSNINTEHRKTLVLRGSAINAPLSDYLKFEIYNESSDSINIFNARLIRYYPKEVPAS